MFYIKPFPIIILQLFAHPLFDLLSALIPSHGVCGKHDSYSSTLDCRAIVSDF